MDDGSTDGTPGLLRRYAERDPRIIVVSTPNRGVARVPRRRVLPGRMGKYIAFLDGDDFGNRACGGDDRLDRAEWRVRYRML